MGFVNTNKPDAHKPSSAKPFNPPGAPKKKLGTGYGEDETRALEMLETGDRLKHMVIYTDGACLGNPGPGGYGVVLLHGKDRKEFSRGFRLTTNNRMEMLACIVGLQTLKEPCAVTLYSDSQYVINSMTKGWAKRWKKNKWKRNGRERSQRRSVGEDARPLRQAQSQVQLGPWPLGEQRERTLRSTGSPGRARLRPGGRFRLRSQTVTIPPA